jgi:hypothetical protein
MIATHLFGCADDHLEAVTIVEADKAPEEILLNAWQEISDSDFLPVLPQRYRAHVMALGERGLIVFEAAERERRRTPAKAPGD